MVKLFQHSSNYLFLEALLAYSCFLLLYSLIANMTILFLPAGVGIMERWNAISANIVPIILIIMGALVLNIVVIAVVVGFIKKHFEGDYEEVKRG